MQPVIAMPQMGNDLFRRYMKSKYVKSLQRAGAEVRWIALEDPELAAREALCCDGLLMPGGADVNPRFYGQEPSEKCGKPNDLRDKGEWELLKAWLPTGKPLLCICRGAQLLNVFQGGTLHQDIQGMQQVRHSHFPSKNKGTHTAQVREDTRLHAILGQNTVLVNSLHHQAVDRVGTGLAVTAVSQDGIVEALEMPEHPFCVGVQWHPEHMSFRNAAQQKIFDTFAEACKTK